QRSLVLDYLCQACYPRTAKIFARESTVRNVDLDGDEIMSSNETDTDETSSDSTTYPLPAELLTQVKQREEIQNCILSGQVDTAIELLNRYFPTVLKTCETSDTQSEPNTTPVSSYLPPTSVEPVHLTLNLRVQSFIEACRTVRLLYPAASTDTPEPASASSSVVVSLRPSTDVLISKGRKLNALVKTLVDGDDAAAYAREIQSVSGLLAYTVPEDSPLAKYLSQDRRCAVAEQINHAILYRLGLPSISYIELYTRYTTTIWSLLHDLRFTPRPGGPLPP
ncbi:hypothetical protein FISHEDRAFT_9972, partial [Fistulina hepatica ATCC 64428]